LHKDAKESMNMKSAYLHLLTDVMTSIAVMIGGITHFNIQPEYNRNDSKKLIVQH